MKRAIYRKYTRGYSHVNYPTLTKDVLSALLKQATSEDQKEAAAAKEELMKYCVKVASAIGSRFACSWPGRDRDILAVAVLAMAEHVHKDAASRLRPDHFMSRMHVCITGAIKDFLAADNQIAIPNRSSWFQETYQRLGSVAYTIVTQAPSVDGLLQEGVDEHSNPKLLKSLGSNKQRDQIVIRDMLAHPVLMPVERRIIQGLLDGERDVEMAVELQVTKQRVGQIKKEALKKMRLIAEGTW